MDKNAVWVGLDLGLRRTQVCVIDEGGQTLHEEDCESSLPALERALSPFPVGNIRLIAVEAGSDTFMVRKLRGAGFAVAIFEARKANKFLTVRRNKTDAGDARGLADLGRLGCNTVSQVYLKSPECEQLRGQLVMRKKLVVVRVAVEGVIRSRLALHGRRLNSTTALGGIRRQVETHLKQLKANDGLDLSNDFMPLLDVSESLRAYLKTIDQELKEKAASHPVCRLLMEVPGIGHICALSFYTAIEDPSRFHHSSDVAAYLGLVPRRHQSGAMSRGLGITKTGSKMTRTHLVTAATVFSAHASDCALKDWYLALRERVGAKRAQVALARKLAILLLTIWRTGAAFEPYPRRDGVADLPAAEGIS